MIWDDDENKPKTPDYFDIFDALGKGYSFVWFQRQVLAQLAFFPLVFVFITGVASIYINPDMHPIRGFLVHLPQSFFLGWYFFVTARLALLGERIETLPGDPGFQAIRRHSMTVTILIFLVFNAAVSALTAFLLLGQNMPNLEFALRGLSIPLLIGLVWAVRYMALYVPAAIGYALKDFLEAVRGFGFSLRVLLLSILSALPVVFISIVVMSLMQSALPTKEEFSLDPLTLFYLAVASVITMILFSVIHSGMVFAAGEIIERRMKEKRPRL